MILETVKTANEKREITRVKTSVILIVIPINEEKNISDNTYLNPDWIEWLMGYPIGYTNLEELEEPQQSKKTEPKD